MPKGNPGIPKSPEHNRKVAEALRGRKKSALHRENLRKPKSEKHKKALSVAQTPEVIAKRAVTAFTRYGFATHLSNPSNNKCCVAYWLERGFSEEQAKAEISLLQKVNSGKRRTFQSPWQPSFWVSLGYDFEEAKQKVSGIQALNSSKSRKAVSKSGTVFIDKLTELSGIQFEREVILEKKFRVDGVNLEHKVVVEFHGTFWHMHPSLFGPEDINRVTGWKAQSKWNEDQGRIKYLTAAGYRVFVVWEHEANLEYVQQLSKELKNACGCG
jgi:G:T-mismatch repair DNA endonuclease (very short patch repair protein)